FEGTPAITAVTQGANGSVVINDDGTVTYTPNADFNGDDRYSYTVTSGGVTETATVTVTVGAVDDAAEVGGDTGGRGHEDSAITGTLTATDAADGLSDGGYFTVEAGDGATNGTASIDPATGDWVYTPNADFHGADRFTVTVTDDDGHRATQVINVTVDPVADSADDSVSVAEDGSSTDNLLGNDRFEGTPAITAVTQGANGSVVINDDGTVTYTPNADFNGDDRYSYTVTSGGVTETATVTVTV
ncbi:Ig-like domain-containing protein, partial [Oceanisphaera sp. KMM 10153]|uniref:Ig-like domain-containing protein n=1 Tax=Oceanisphaera submarina TaxID=3390193 RepID=UPI003976D728